MTQAQLAEQLGITDRAVSKWETGKCLPDAGTMLELCDILGISINELFAAEKLEARRYREAAERNLLELAHQEEENNRKMLKLELVVGYTCTISFLVLLFVGSFAVDGLAWRIGTIAVAFAMLIAGTTVALKLEQSVGYYECQNCHERYVPSMKSVYFAMHMGRTRYMKCPRCGKRTWQKKTLVK